MIFLAFSEVLQLRLLTTSVQMVCFDVVQRSATVYPESIKLIPLVVPLILQIRPFDHLDAHSVFYSYQRSLKVSS